VSDRCPPRETRRPEQGREHHRPERRRQGRAVRDHPLAEHQVDGERDGGQPGHGDADRSQVGGPDLGDDGQADQHEADRQPQPRFDLFGEEHPADDGHHQYGGVFDQQRDADRQLAQRDGVEPLHQRHADDAEYGQLDQLAASDPQRLAVGQQQYDAADDGGRERPEQGELGRRDALAQHDLGHAAVRAEQERRHQRAAVAHERSPSGAPARFWSAGRLYETW
jgi:hypothetical protein